MAGPSLDGLVNPDMLVWSREQSRMNVAEAAQRIGQSPERLAEWESGGRVPTLNQLRILADAYKRSIGVFFLRERPRVPRRPADYRRLELSTGGAVGSVLSHGIRAAEVKREAALDIFAQLEENPPKWDLNLPSGIPADDAANAISDRLGITPQTRGRWRTSYDALNGWRDAIERLGVIVVQLSRVEMTEMRGCSLALFPLPVIILNGADSPLGRVFTLLHELTHLARAESGLCDLEADEPRQRAEEVVEAFCNQVAGLVLVPRHDLLALPDVRVAGPDTQWSKEQLRSLSRIFWASREAVLRRLLDYGKTSRAFYQTMHEEFKREYQRERAEAEGFVAPHLRIMLSNGRVLTRLAIDAYTAQAITGSELARVLDAKLDHLPRIRQALAAELAA